jgi:ribose transport system permease protein
VLYVISGTCAAAAGVLLTGYTGSSFLGSGDPYQLMSIAAVVLGGASIFGGSGGYGNTIAGVAIITLLLSVLQVIGIPAAGQDILYGVVILVMLILFRYSGERPAR